ncbi:MAG TPA: hypothetical protein VD813_02625, partial [Pseudonocardia sp.]|nr:hypothetical protein [Pseudonocardia sp.]
MSPSAGPPRLTNPYASVDPDGRPRRSGLAAGRALVAGVIGLGAVAVFTGTAAADEQAAADSATSELAGTGDEATGTGTGNGPGGEDASGEGTDGAPAGDGTRPAGSEEQDGDGGQDTAGGEAAGADQATEQGSSSGDGPGTGTAAAGPDGSGADGGEPSSDTGPDGDTGPGTDSGSDGDTDSGSGAPEGPRALTLPEGEITLSDEARQDAEDRATAERTESPSGERRITGVPVGEDRLTVQDGGFTVGSPRFDTQNADVEVAEDGEISVTRIGADLGTVGFEAGGRDPESGLTFRTENTVTLDPQELRVDVPNGPDQPEPAGQTATADQPGDADRGEAPDAPDSLRVQSQTTVGVTTAEDDPVQAGLTFGVAGDVTLSNGENDVVPQGTLSTPIHAYVGTSEDGENSDYRIAAEATYAEQATFGPDGDDQSSTLAIIGDARVSTGPNLNAEGTELVEEGVRAEVYATGQYTEIDDRQMEFAGATPGTSVTAETDQRAGQVAVGGSVDARVSERSDDGGWDVDLTAGASVEGGYEFTEFSSDDLGIDEPVRTERVFGEAGLDVATRFGDLEPEDGDLVYVEVSGQGRVTADGADTEFSGEARAGVGAQVGDVRGEVGYTVATDAADGSPRGGPDFTIAAEDLVGPADVELSYRETGDDDRVAVQVRFNGENGGSPSEEPATPESAQVDLPTAAEGGSSVFGTAGDAPTGDGEVALADFSLGDAVFDASGGDAGVGAGATSSGDTPSGGSGDTPAAPSDTGPSDTGPSGTEA